MGCNGHHILPPLEGERVTTPREPPGRHHGGPRPQEPSRDDPRLGDDGRPIFTEDVLDGYFRAVDPHVLARQRRHRHLRHGIVLTLAALLLIALTVTAMQVLRGQWTIPGWEASPPREPLLCPAGTFDYAQDSPVTVFNGTTIGGLAGDVAHALEERGFTIGEVGNQDVTMANMVAIVTSGEAGRNTAFAVQRNIEGSVYQPDWRAEGTVDVIVGTKYEGLVPAAGVDTRPGSLDCQRLETGAPTADRGWSPGPAALRPSR
jgi:hypothetical protein